MATVLVVDDERPVRELAARMLQEAGYRRTATKVDAILTDVVMPQMTGTELLAKVQAHRPELPVVLMSRSAAS